MINLNINDANIKGDEVEKPELPSPVFRFPHFPVRLNSYTYFADDFERTYENFTLEMAPTLAEIRQSSCNFKEFEAKTPGNSGFWKVLKASPNGRIFFLDKHFSHKNFVRLVDVANEMSQQQDRLKTTLLVIMGANAFSTEMQDEYQILKDTAETKHWGDKVNIEVYELKSEKGNDVRDLIHDRFVVFDSQFWHFGASAGGMHESFNAYSGPWYDKAGRMNSLMNELLLYCYKRN